MSTVLITTSSTRPTNASAGDLYFETDTNKLIVYTGGGWSTYSAATQGAVVQETSEDNPIPITYGSLETVLAATDAEVGDFFVMPATKATATIKFQETLANNTYFYLVDDSGTYFRLEGKTNPNEVTPTYPLRFDLDTANYGTPSWQGSTNLKNVIESTDHFGTSSFNITISGDNNEIINLELPNTGKTSYALCSDNKAQSSNFHGGRNIEFLIYKGENNFLTFSSDN
jgi:hypothetical protein